MTFSTSPLLWYRLVLPCGHHPYHCSNLLVWQVAFDECMHQVQLGAIVCRCSWRWLDAREKERVASRFGAGGTGEGRARSVRWIGGVERRAPNSADGLFIRRGSCLRGVVVRCNRDMIRRQHESLRRRSSGRYNVIKDGSCTSMDSPAFFPLALNPEADGADDNDTEYASDDSGYDGRCIGIFRPVARGCVSFGRRSLWCGLRVARMKGQHGTEAG